MYVVQWTPTSYIGFNFPSGYKQLSTCRSRATLKWDFLLTCGSRSLNEPTTNRRLLFSPLSIGPISKPPSSQVGSRCPSQLYHRIYSTKRQIRWLNADGNVHVYTNTYHMKIRIHINIYTKNVFTRRLNGRNGRQWWAPSRLTRAPRSSLCIQRNRETRATHCVPFLSCLGQAPLICPEAPVSLPDSNTASFLALQILTPSEITPLL